MITLEWVPLLDDLVHSPCRQIRVGRRQAFLNREGSSAEGWGGTWFGGPAPPSYSTVGPQNARKEAGEKKGGWRVGDGRKGQAGWEGRGSGGAGGAGGPG